MPDDDLTIEDSIDGEESTQSPFAAGLPIQDALGQLRLRLLDLTGRNRLINFKNGPGKTIQFVDSDFNAAFERLAGDNPRGLIFDFVPEPNRADWETKNGRLARPDAKIYAGRLGRSISYELSATSPGSGTRTRQVSTTLRTLYYADELGKHGRKLAREAKLAVEETGSNMLHLVFGFLEFPDTPGSDKLYQAPLLCVPVNLSISDEGKYSTFTVNSSGEELAENLSLVEKIKRDFGLNLPTYLDEEGESAHSYLRRVGEVVKELPGWKVQHRVTLSLLSFANMLMVKDIDPNTWADGQGTSALLNHPLIRQVFEGSGTSASEPTYAGEYDIDTHPRGDLPLIYDADSSQHSALIDVLEGKNRVIEGPPGTGKSQTITNIIAAALQAGKTVLFVAEKLAALEVVKSRLEQAGLEQFVLELHSNKTNKKRVLEDLERRLAMKAPRLDALPEQLQQLGEKRDELRAHMHVMASKDGNSLGLTLHQVMWRAELNRLRCGASAALVANLQFPAALGTTPAQFLALSDSLKYAAEQFDAVENFDESHPFWGFFPSGLGPEDTIPIQQVFAKFEMSFSAFRDGLNQALSLLGTNDVTFTSETALKLIAVLSELAPANPDEVNFSLLPSIFSAKDPLGRESLKTLRELEAGQEYLAALEKLRDKLLIGAFPLTIEELQHSESIVKELETLGLAKCDFSQLTNLYAQLKSATDVAPAAMEELGRVAELFRVPFEGTPEEVQQVLAIRAALESAPLNLLHLRHPELNESSAITSLTRSFAEAKEILALGRALDDNLYMDSVPAEAEVSDAVNTLREGDRWYRILQAPWRKAVNTHKKLTRSKGKKFSSQERLVELESVRQYCRRRLAWEADPNVKRFSARSFDGYSTPFDDLISVAGWIKEISTALADNRVPDSIFNPMTIERVDVIALLEKSRRVRTALAALDTLMLVARVVLKAAPEIAARIDELPWRQRIFECSSTVETLQIAVAFLGTRAKPEVTAMQAGAAMAKAIDIPNLAASLASHQGGMELFGDSYRGRDTLLATAFAAHTYGTLLLNASLPPSIEKILLSAESVANYVAIEESIIAINTGWQDLVEFERALKLYGEMNVRLWAGTGTENLSELVDGLVNRTSMAITKMPALLSWAQYVEARQVCWKAGLSDFLSHVESGTLLSCQLLPAFGYRFYAAIAEQTFRTNNKLRLFSGTRHAAVRKDYAVLDRDVIRLRGAQVARDCIRSSAPPQGYGGVRVDDKSELRLLEHLIPQQRPRVPLRKMLVRAGRAIQALKPCFMMGPQAVAQFLQPGQLHFDIVIMDEASQLKPEQALGAIARGTQLVVVGDPKQLPPTSFFSRMATPEDDGDSGKGAAAVDAESILDVCISHFHPVRTLRWHYRSQHESLIAFSNQFFYRGNLVVFPSPFGKSKELGLRYHYVREGIYENQMNLVEARRVVDAAASHILERPQISLGIVTLNVKQRDLIAEMLEQRLKSVDGADAFRDAWKARGMDLFVKNLENVQGDERDCIMISTTFGKPATAGVVRQNFGPISRSGGWRRLNVLFTRAKKSVVVFSSMRPEDIVVDNSTPEGTKALRNYLQFARDNVLPQNEETDLPPDSDFEIAVLDVLRAKGYEVVPQLGVAGFRIDIAVRHPDFKSGFLAAIECDGASYHSGISVRDRDRIRQEILEGLGWRGRIWRIWSTDWFRNPQQETDRLLSFLSELRLLPLPSDDDESEVDDFAVDVEADGEEATPSGQRPEDELVLKTEEDEVEVECGDLISYCNTEEPAHIYAVKITSTQTNFELGLVAEGTPLAQVLLGASEGDEVVLRVPGKKSATLRILSVRRKLSDDSTHSQPTTLALG